MTFEVRRLRHLFVKSDPMGEDAERIGQLSPDLKLTSNFLDAYFNGWAAS